MDFETVVLRISGEQGTPYRCFYNTSTFEEGERVPYTMNETGTLGRKPAEYEAQIIDSRDYFDSFSAHCMVTSPSPPDDRPMLKAEVLVNGRVMDEDETRPDPPNKTSAQSTTVKVNYAPRCDGPLRKDRPC